MGQYYKPVSIEKMEHVYSHSYDNGLKLMEHSWIGNDFVRAVEGIIAPGGKWHGDRIVWAGDYADPEPETITESNEDGNTLYSLSKNNEIRPDVPKKRFKYLLNLDSKEFVDMDKVPVTKIYNNYEYRVHPLPLLTCEGNGRGGGDYHGESELIGKWARNRVVVDNVLPENFTELVFDLVE